MAQVPRVLYVCVLAAIVCAVILFATDTYRSVAEVVPVQSRSQYSRRRDISSIGNSSDQTPKPPQLLAFVGIMTATKPERRRVVRATWLPADLQRYETDTGIRLRFVVGVLQDTTAQAALQQEQLDYRDFVAINVTETYANLVLKVYAFLQHVQATYNPAFIIKTDDDLYIRPDRLAQAIPQWQAQGSGYIGVMRAGTEAHAMTNSPWYEPLGVLHNHQYYMYASGGMYALSAGAVQLLTRVPLSQRRLSGGGDDTSVGLWVMGYNIPYLDDRRLGMVYDGGSCPDHFIESADAAAVLTGGCNGLCDAETTIAKLHADSRCTKALTADLPMIQPMYDYSAVGCIQVDDTGNINRSSCYV